jgi:pimeloyl-ACP methyl ester carboxylesterase
VIGDWLAHTNSPLAIEMQLRRAAAGPRAVVLVHGSAMSDRQWLRRTHDHGAALARDDGWVPVYVRYNSGLPIAENGRKLARLLDELADCHDIALVGHSMGGLVARSACHAAETEGRAWRTRLRSLVTLGSPHLGAPLERLGKLIEILLPISSYSEPLARLGKIRSAGITDLRYGLRLPLPVGVDCHAIAAENDRLVPVQSAYGSFPAANCHVVPGVNHLDLLGCPNTYQLVRRALANGISPS